MNSLIKHSFQGSPVKFHPWIGDNFETGGLFSRRVLVLGEAHYGEQQYDTNFTIEVVQDLVFKCRNRFFTTLTKTLLPDADYGWLPNESRIECFQSIAFYNYIQEIVGLSSRIRPKEDHWSGAIEAFKVVLETLKPEAVLVLGKELWYHVLYGLKDSENYSIEPIISHVLQSGKIVEFGNIPHPSSFGFRFKDHQNFVKSLTHKSHSIK